MLKTFFVASLTFAVLGLIGLPASSADALPEENGTLPDPERLHMNLLAAELKAEQALWIPAAAGEFFAIHRVAETPNPEGTLLMLHDAGQHPAWPGDLLNIATQLPRATWNTLAIALPRAEAELASDGNTQAGDPEGEDHTQTDAAPNELAQTRINDAVEWLQQEGNGSIVLYGQGKGAEHAVAFVCGDNTGADQIKGLVLVNAPTVEGLIPACLTSPTLPLLDLYEGHVFLEAENAADRLAHAKREGLELYQQAEHNEPLARRVLGFLRRHFL